MKGLIFSVRKYSVHDGPGIRVTFFMKGCPLKCIWCHNPEGISPMPEEIVQTRKIGQREFARKETAGKYYSVNEILEILRKEEIFIRKSGGGVTFSGGEPFMQPEFLAEALRACREEGYHTAVDTSGFATGENFRSVIPLTDLFLYDIKHLDCSSHEKLTGMPNDLILGNFNLLPEQGKSVYVRIPVIPGLNDDPDHLEKLRDFLSSAGKGYVKKICLLPFHKTGLSKYKRLGLPFPAENIEQPSAERMKELKEFFSETGIMVRIGG